MSSPGGRDHRGRGASDRRPEPLGVRQEMPREVGRSHADGALDDRREALTLVAS